MLREFDLFREIPAFVAEPMLKYLKLYYIIGGMPEAVKTYIETEDLTAVDTVLDRINQDLRSDFAHHAEPKDIIRIDWIWDSIPKQLAKENNKFVFSHVRKALVRGIWKTHCNGSWMPGWSIAWKRSLPRRFRFLPARTRPFSRFMPTMWGSFEKRPGWHFALSLRSRKDMAFSRGHSWRITA